MEKNESPLDNLVLAFPCPVTWDSMSGDDRKRLCAQCSKHVFDISGLNKRDAEELLGNGASDDGICVRYYLRTDGKIKTDNCPRFLKPVRSQMRKLQKAISIGCAFILSALNLQGCTQLQNFLLPLNNYTPQDDELDNYLGFMAPNEIRERYSEVYRSEPNNQKAIGTLHEMQAAYKVRKQIDLGLLDRYKTELVQSKELNLALNAAVLECLILNKSPNKLTFETKRLEMEKIRFDMLAQTLRRANNAIRDKNYFLANQQVGNFQHGCLEDKSLIEPHEKFYANCKKWPWIDRFDKQYMVATKEQILEIIKITELVQKSGISYPANSQNFTAALRLKSLPISEQEKAFEEERKQAKDSEYFMLMADYPMVVAEYLGYDDNYLIDYNNPPIAKFRVLEVLNIPAKAEFIPVPQPIQQIDTYFNLSETEIYDFKTHPEWKFEPEMMPSLNSKWILSLSMFGNNRYTTFKGNVGIVPLSECNIEKVKKGIIDYKAWKKNAN